MFNPPAPTNGRLLPNSPSQTPPPSAPIAQMHSTVSQMRPPVKPSKYGSVQSGTPQRIVSADDEVKLLFEECNVASGNAQILSDALTYAKPEDTLTNSHIRVSSYRAHVAHCFQNIHRIAIVDAKYQSRSSRLKYLGRRHKSIS
jgi:hypothetical protein